MKISIIKKIISNKNLTNLRNKAVQKLITINHLNLIKKKIANLNNNFKKKLNKYTNN